MRRHLPGTLSVSNDFFNETSDQSPSATGFTPSCPNHCRQNSALIASQMIKTRFLSSLPVNPRNTSLPICDDCRNQITVPWRSLQLQRFLRNVSKQPQYHCSICGVSRRWPRSSAQSGKHHIASRINAASSTQISAVAVYSCRHQSSSKGQPRIWARG